MKTITADKPILVVLAVIAVLYLGHIVELDVLPMIDLPFHLGAATIYRYYDAPDNNFAQYYTLDVFPNPNVLHLWLCGATKSLSVESVNKIYLCLYVVLLPLSVLLLIRKLRGDPWFALLSFTLLYHYSFSWGFVDFTMSVPFVLFFFYGLLGLDDHPNMRRTAVLALLLLCIFFIHILAAMLCAAMLLLKCVAGVRENLLREVKNALVVVPLLILVIVWRTSWPEGSGSLGLSDYYRSEYVPTLYRRGAFFLWDNFALYADVKGWIVAACFTVFIAHFPVVSCLRNRGWAVRWTRLLSTDRLLLVAGLLFYLVLPRKTPGTAHLYERFSVFALLALVVLASRTAPQRGRSFRRVSIVAVVLVHFVLWTNYFVAFRTKASSFGRDLFPDGGGRLAALIFEPDFRGRPVYNHFQDYYTVWKQGIAVSKVGDYRYYPIRRRASTDVLPAYNEWIGRWGSYDGRYRDMEYLLIKGSVPSGLEVHLDEFTRIKSTGDWTLYKNEATE